MGAINAAVPALLLNIGFSRLPASLVTLTLALGPVFTALTAHLAFRDDRFSERQSRRARAQLRWRRLPLPDCRRIPAADRRLPS